MSDVIDIDQRSSPPIRTSSTLITAHHRPSASHAALLSLLPTACSSISLDNIQFPSLF
jgi:hypothetical protein